MFSDPKYSFSVCQKIFFGSNPKLIFFTKFNLVIRYGQGHCLFSIVFVNSVLNGKALVAAFNYEKALVWAFSVIV